MGWAKARKRRAHALGTRNDGMRVRVGMAPARLCAPYLLQRLLDRVKLILRQAHVLQRVERIVELVDSARADQRRGDSGGPRAPRLWRRPRRSEPRSVRTIVDEGAGPARVFLVACRRVGEPRADRFEPRQVDVLGNARMGDADRPARRPAGLEGEARVAAGLGHLDADVVEDVDRHAGAGPAAAR